MENQQRTPVQNPAAAAASNNWAHLLFHKQWHEMQMLPEGPQFIEEVYLAQGLTTAVVRRAQEQVDKILESRPTVKPLIKRRRVLFKPSETPDIGQNCLERPAVLPVQCHDEKTPSPTPPVPTAVLSKPEQPTIIPKITAPQPSIFDPVISIPTSTAKLKISSIAKKSTTPKWPHKNTKQMKSEIPEEFEIKDCSVVLIDFLKHFGKTNRFGEWQRKSKNKKDDFKVKKSKTTKPKQFSQVQKKRSVSSHLNDQRPAKKAKKLDNLDTSITGPAPTIRNSLKNGPSNSDGISSAEECSRDIINGSSNKENILAQQHISIPAELGSCDKTDINSKQPIFKRNGAHPSVVNSSKKKMDASTDASKVSTAATVCQVKEKPTISLEAYHARRNSGHKSDQDSASGSFSSTESNVNGHSSTDSESTSSEGETETHIVLKTPKAKGNNTKAVQSTEKKSPQLAVKLGSDKTSAVCQLKPNLKTSTASTTFNANGNPKADKPPRSAVRLFTNKTPIAPQLNKPTLETSTALKTLNATGNDPKPDHSTEDKSPQSAVRLGTDKTSVAPQLNKPNLDTSTASKIPNATGNNLGADDLAEDTPPQSALRIGTDKTSVAPQLGKPNATTTASKTPNAAGNTSKADHLTEDKSPQSALRKSIDKTPIAPQLGKPTVETSTTSKTPNATGNNPKADHSTEDKFPQSALRMGTDKTSVTPQLVKPNIETCSTSKTPNTTGNNSKAGHSKEDKTPHSAPHSLKYLTKRKVECDSSTDPKRMRLLSTIVENNNDSQCVGFERPAFPSDCIATSELDVSSATLQRLQILPRDSRTDRSQLKMVQWENSYCYPCNLKFSVFNDWSNHTRTCTKQMMLLE